MDNPTNPDPLPVPQRLIDAAQACFLNDDYHRVSTRQIAAAADTNISMIPILFKEVFEAQLEQPMDKALLDRLAEFNGRLFAAGLQLKTEHDEEN